MKEVSNYIAGHISQGGLKFATQISPLLNHYQKFPRNASALGKVKQFCLAKVPEVNRICSV
jgi:hypothetical protein